MSDINKADEALRNYLKQWQDVGERLKSISEPLRKQNAKLTGLVKPVFDAREALFKSVEPIAALTEKLNQGMKLPQRAALISADLARLSRQAQDFSRSIEGMIGPVLEQMEKSFRELPEKTRNALIVLGTHGWYLDLDMPMTSLWEINRELKNGNVEEVVEALVSYFEDRLDTIEKSIVEKYPRRKKIVASAFKAHRRGEFELSIPVLIAQADGICKEVVRENFFLKNNDRKPRTASYVEQIATDTLLSAFLAPLAHSLPIAASEKDRGPDFKELNRHSVLHGEALDYGTKENGLKAISLLNYVAHVLLLKAHPKGKEKT